jgi:hypothetical protein
LPGHFERHSRSRWEWGAPGSRSAELRRAVDDDPAGKPPGKKDPARCKGNRGGPHVPEIALHHETPEDEFRSRCRWGAMWDRETREQVIGWHCEHEERCAKCGLIFERRIADERCPAYPGAPAQRAVAEQRLFEWIERRRTSPAWARGRKPVISGPQGYRRRRDKA